MDPPVAALTVGVVKSAVKKLTNEIQKEEQYLLKNVDLDANVYDFDSGLSILPEGLPLDAGLKTVILNIPDTVRSVASITAVSWVEET